LSAVYIFFFMRGEFLLSLHPRMNACFHACVCAKFISRRDGLSDGEG